MVYPYDDYSVFTTERYHSEQPESINDTYVMEKVDNNVLPDSSDMSINGQEANQNAKETDDECVLLASLIANIKLDVDENKNIQKQLKKENTSLTQEIKKNKRSLKDCKIELESVFTTERYHSEQPESINDTYVMEKVDNNVLPDSSNMSINGQEANQNAKETDDECVLLASLIANIKLDVDEKKNIQKQLKKKNTSLTHEIKKNKRSLKDCKIELERYKTFQTNHQDKEKFEIKCKETLAFLVDTKRQCHDSLTREA
nr:hypothetical protein [Tanacetum cinerariifolium]